jgi:hypothetical protein
MSCEFSTNRDFTKTVPIMPEIPYEIRPHLPMNNIETVCLFQNKSGISAKIIKPKP